MALSKSELTPEQLESFAVRYIENLDDFEPSPGVKHLAVSLMMLTQENMTDLDKWSELLSALWHELELQGWVEAADE